MENKKYVQKTLSLPSYITTKLDDISKQTGFSQTCLVLLALTRYLPRYEKDCTDENYLYCLSRGQGWGAEGE